MPTGFSVFVNIGGKLTRGEPVSQEDLDRVTNVPRVAASMRTNAMVNLGLQDIQWILWLVVAVVLLAVWAWRRRHG